MSPLNLYAEILTPNMMVLGSVILGSDYGTHPHKKGLVPHKESEKSSLAFSAM